MVPELLRSVGKNIEQRVDGLKAEIKYRWRLSETEQALNARARVARLGLALGEPSTIDNAREALKSFYDLAQSLDRGEKIGFDLDPDAFDRLVHSGNKPWFRTYKYSGFEDDFHIVYAATARHLADPSEITDPDLLVQFRILSESGGKSFSFSPEEVGDIRISK